MGPELYNTAYISAYVGLFCGTHLDVIFLFPCVANLPGFSYMLMCATSYLSTNLAVYFTWSR